MTIPYIRLARPTDVPAIMPIIESARQLLAQQGIPQWQDGHPNQATIQADIAQQIGYVFVVDQQLAGYTALLQTPDPNYQPIDGAWGRYTTPEHYATLHRVAISAQFRGHHLGRLFISNLVTRAYELGFRDLRIDTHQQNHTMQHLIESTGFKYRGIITIQRDGSPRLAYQLLY
ncbi:MAG: GNAT family N-acetyltransferase [Lactobacillus sp.]|jgi:Acetyltransferases|nr:MAG: GNAT family N-acetyltransferase [Lactobacillus sp.]